MGETSLPEDTYCGGCRRPLDEPSDSPEDERPCACGFVSRLVSKHTGGSIGFYSLLGLKAKSQPGTRRGLSSHRTFLEAVCGDSFYSATGIWNRLARTIDRARNWYSEHITGAGGNLIRHQEHPLVEHQWHGSAKRDPSEDAIVLETEQEWVEIRSSVPGRWTWDAAENVAMLRCAVCPALWADARGLTKRDVDEIRKHGEKHKSAA